MSSKVLQIAGVPVPVKLEKSTKAKRLSMTIRPFEGVRIAVPRWCSFQFAQEFLHKNLAWVLRNIDSIKKQENLHATVKEAGGFNIAGAKRNIIERLEYLANLHSFKYNRVFIRNQKTRWGSCSGQNNINLNINLAKLSDELRDYVILHELVHTKVKNHGSRFWAELDKYASDAKGLDVKLRKYWL